MKNGGKPVGIADIQKQTKELKADLAETTQKESQERIERMRAEIQKSPTHLLKNPKLFEIITDEFKKKVVKEEDTCKTIFLGMCMAFVENCDAASSNMMVNSASGAGKDWVVKAVGSILEPVNETTGIGLFLKKTRISGTVFTYWHDSEQEPHWNWDGKILYLEDVSNEILNHDVFKVMASGGSDATVVIQQRAYNKKINGKPVIIITSASATPKPELVRRFVMIGLDESDDQTKLVKRLETKMAREGTLPDYDKRITEAISMLKRIKVKIPYVAEDVEKLFPEHILMRTHLKRFLDLIKASCALHQFQREQDEAGFFIATGQDWDIARVALIKTTTNALMIPLTKEHKEIIEVFKKLQNKTPDLVSKPFFSVSELEEHVHTMSDKWIRIQLDWLTSTGFLDKASEERAESKKRVMVWRLKEQLEISIPTFDCMNCNNCMIVSPVSISLLVDRQASDLPISDNAKKVPSTIEFDTINEFDTIDNANHSHDFVKVGSVSKEGESFNVGDKIL
jgi:ferredoxin